MEIEKAEFPIISKVYIYVVILENKTFCSPTKIRIIILINYYYINRKKLAKLI